MRKDGSLSLSLSPLHLILQLTERAPPPLTTDACLSEGVEGEKKNKTITYTTDRQASVCARDEQTERSKHTLTETRFPLPSLTRND